MTAPWQDGEIEGVVVRPVGRFTDPRGWLSEIYRLDELDPTVAPAMTYVSVTRPGVARGPHEHLEQTDLFAFIGPGRFRLKLWDARPDSPTRGRRMTLEAGEGTPRVILVPPRIVHGYRNVSDCDGWVINCPNRLYKGPKRDQPVDEVRHEDDANSPFSLDD